MSWQESFPTATWVVSETIYGIEILRRDTVVTQLAIESQGP